MTSQSVQGTFLAPFAGLESHLPGLALCIAVSFHRVGDRVPVDRPPVAENTAIGGGDASTKLIFDDCRTANRFGMDQIYYVPRAGSDRIACRLNGGVSRQQNRPKRLHQCSSVPESLSFGEGMSILRSFAPLPRFPASIQWLPARVPRGVRLPGLTRPWVS